MLVGGSILLVSCTPKGQRPTFETPKKPSQVPVTLPSSSTTMRVPARITLNFAGDTNFAGPRGQLLDSDPSAILGPISPILSDADLTVINLETALTTRGVPEPKEFTFRTDERALDVLRAGGADVASIANNHGLDYGPDGVPDALGASTHKKFPVIGIGQNENQALKPFRTIIRGNRVTVIAATQVLDNELIPRWTATPTHPGLASAKRVATLLAHVRAARKTSDTLIVFLHWGIETHTCPSVVQQTLAQQLVQAGADIIVGGHAHRVQGTGRLGDAIVDYGLGNFAFYAGSDAAATTGVLQVTIGGGKPAKYQWRPAHIDGNGIPHPLQGEQATEALASWNALRGCTGLNP